MQPPGSGLREDLFRSDPFEPVDGTGPDQASVVPHLVRGGAGRLAAGSVDGLPGDVELIAADHPFTMEDGTGDDPVEQVGVGLASPGDLEAPAVLDSDRIDSIHDVGPGDAGALLEDDAGGAGGEEQGSDEHESPKHVSESMDVSRRISKVLLWVGAVVVVGVLAFALFEPIQVLPRMRIAPGFTLTDSSGALFTSDDTRGEVTLYTFLPADCGDVCVQTLETMQEVGQRVLSEVDLGGLGFRLATIVLDGDRSDLDRLAREHSVEGVDWVFAGGDPEELARVVGDGFDVYFEEDESGNLAFDRVYTIVDSTGIIRGEYRYVTLTADEDRLIRHLSLLGDETRNSNGAASLAYEAAHLFLCYP